MRGDGEVDAGDGCPVKDVFWRRGRHNLVKNWMWMREKGRGWGLKLESPVVPLNEPRNGRNCGDSGSGALFWAALCSMYFLGVRV